ncbi:MAG: hypothetical protein PHN45_05175 [Methylococcales bacterium]|nr:hypothetical protein [Methylococcales bacterium]MDD5754128.1 hypothetical protein [Methylococcales bacterium]
METIKNLNNSFDTTFAATRIQKAQELLNKSNKALLQKIDSFKRSTFFKHKSGNSLSHDALQEYAKIFRVDMNWFTDRNTSEEEFEKLLFSIHGGTRFSTIGTETIQMIGNESYVMAQFGRFFKSLDLPLGSVRVAVSTKPSIPGCTPVENGTLVSYLLDGYVRSIEIKTDSGKIHTVGGDNAVSCDIAAQTVKIDIIHEDALDIFSQLKGNEGLAVFANNENDIRLYDTDTLKASSYSLLINVLKIRRDEPSLKQLCNLPIRISRYTNPELLCLYFEAFKAFKKIYSSNEKWAEDVTKFLIKSINKLLSHECNEKFLVATIYAVESLGYAATHHPKTVILLQDALLNHRNNDNSNRYHRHFRCACFVAMMTATDNLRLKNDDLFYEKILQTSKELENWREAVKITLQLP